MTVNAIPFITVSLYLSFIFANTNPKRLPNIIQTPFTIVPNKIITFHSSSLSNYVSRETFSFEYYYYFGYLSIKKLTTFNSSSVFIIYLHIFFFLRNLIICLFLFTVLKSFYIFINLLI